MSLQQLAVASEQLAQTRSRLRKTAIAADVLRLLGPGERRIGAAFLAGRLVDGSIGVGPAIVHRSVAQPAARATLSLRDVADAFAAVAAVEGRGAADRRIGLLRNLHARATAAEQSFLGRLLLGELRQGALDGIVTDAIARAGGLDPSLVRRAVMLSGCAADVAEAALGDGAAALARLRLQPFRPLQPMLAQPADDLASLFDAQAGSADAPCRIVAEHKLDGARVQVHRVDDRVQVFSRQLNDVTASVPEVVDAALSMRSRRFIIDAETIALRDDGRPQPFQVTMQRFGRRLDVAAMRERVPLSLRVFDCLHIDGEDLIDRTLAQRSARLDDAVPGEYRVARALVSNPREAAAFLRAALAAGHEGIMAKAANSHYHAGSRGGDWLKIKPVHTLDLVVVAAEWGSGRRHGKLSNLHLAARDAESGTFVMLGKTFKGLTDQLLRWQTAELLARETGRDGNTVRVRPELVVEVAFNELQRSTRYPAGLALRFARVKGYRSDKHASDADTLDTVRRIHEAGIDALAARV
ncbi:MAG: ATP-dependent DNA ligase [Gammaproteobacteria bacterium]|nr:ATP-dependent DNA ligase [Gammaproteobacteria bacterium]